MANARRRTQRASRSTTRNTAARTAAPAALESEEARLGRRVDWQNEFVYIRKDLRQLLIVTAVLFVLLFAVGYFL